MTLLAGEIERGLPTVIGGVRIGSGREKQPDDGDVSVGGGRVQRGVPTLHAGVYRRAVREEDFDTAPLLRALRRDRAVQRGNLDEVVPRDRRGVASPLEQHVCGVRVTE